MGPVSSNSNGAKAELREPRSGNMGSGGGSSDARGRSSPIGYLAASSMVKAVLGFRGRLSQAAERLRKVGLMIAKENLESRWGRGFPGSMISHLNALQ